jgi:MoxR-like ATPase
VAAVTQDFHHQPKNGLGFVSKGQRLGSHVHECVDFCEDSLRSGERSYRLETKSRFFIAGRLKGRSSWPLTLFHSLNQQQLMAAKDKIEIQGVQLTLSQPHETTVEWIGQQEILKQILACWLVVNERDLPLTPRIVGVPGIGKTALGTAAAAARGQDLYIYQCTADTRPEDLLVTPVLADNGRIAYHASPLVTAMIRGGVCVLDEGNRMNEKSWASLAPLLDHRRYVESIVAGISIAAHPEFRCAVTMNQDESTFEIPDYILSRLQPTLTMGFPDPADEMAILQYHLPFCSGELLDMTVEFLQKAHSLKLDFSTRDGINLLRYAVKLIAQDKDHPLANDVAWREALEKCLGSEAFDLDRLARNRVSSLGGQTLPMGFADFFFNPNDPLRPGFAEGEEVDEDSAEYLFDDDEDEDDFEDDDLDDDDSDSSEEDFEPSEEEMQEFRDILEELEEPFKDIFPELKDPPDDDDVRPPF